MARFTVVLDACVLYPAPVRDALLSLASRYFYQPLWTDKIQEEWINAILRNREDLSREKLERTQTEMLKHFEGALVTGYECLIESIVLPDPDDRHVVAAAIRGNADAIVTMNKRDFPADVLEKQDLEVIHPDDFIRYQYDLNQSQFLQAIGAMRARLKNPPKSQDEFIDTLENCGLVLTADLLREFVHEI